MRETAGDWLVVVVPLGVSLLALGGYFAWQWYTRPRFHCMLF